MSHPKRPIINTSSESWVIGVSSPPYAVTTLDISSTIANATVPAVTVTAVLAIGPTGAFSTGGGTTSAIKISTLVSARGPVVRLPAAAGGVGPQRDRSAAAVMVRPPQEKPRQLAPGR